MLALRSTNGFIVALLQAKCNLLMLASGRLRPLTRPIVWLLQVMAMAMGSIDRNRRMTSNYVVLARKL